MAAGVIRLLRTPLLEGEVPYAMTNVDQGLFVNGAKKGEKMPRTHRKAEVLPDGRLVWELPDTEPNRQLAESLLPTTPNPPFAYSVEYPDASPKQTVSQTVQVKNSPQRTPPAPKGPGASPKPAKGGKSKSGVK
jgi:hypothetical protein